MYKASVIIPYYKKKFFIKKTIKSVLNQSYKNFEIIIIYDDNDKKELKFIKNIKALDKRIKLIINNKNLGAGFSRNKGIFKASGEYVCFIDADDTWKKNKLLFQINYMKKNNYLATHTSYEIVNPKNKIIGQRNAKKINNYEKLLLSCDIGLSTVILKKKIFSKRLKFAKIKTKEDFVLWLNILKRGITIYPIQKKLTRWTKNPQSLSSSTFQKLRDSFSVYNYYMKFSYIKSLYYTFVLSLNFLKKQYMD